MLNIIHKLLKSLLEDSEWTEWSIFGGVSFLQYLAGQITLRSLKQIIS